MENRIIDSHHHFWQVGKFDYPWMSREVEILYRDYLPPALEAVLKNCGVAQTVVVQASNSIEETRWLLRLAEDYPFIAGVVGWVDLTKREVGEQLDELLAAHPKFKGVRHLAESEPSDDWLIQPAVLRGLRELALRSMAYDLLIHPRHLKHVGALAENCPELRLVIDHLAKPPVAAGRIDGWATALREAAKHPNVFCKLSGLVTEANLEAWSSEDLRPFIESALEFFGSSRLMFGSDYPVCLRAASYERVLDSFQSILAGLSDADRRLIFGENAAGFYKL